LFTKYSGIYSPIWKVDILDINAAVATTEGKKGSSSLTIGSQFETLIKKFKVTVGPNDFRVFNISFMVRLWAFARLSAGRGGVVT
jgi:hypothetical protein